MKIKVKLHPDSSQEKIEKKEENRYEIWLKEKPIDNKANEKLIKILSKHFKRKVSIKSVFTSREKIVEILK